jgi:hypothetical protein
MSMPGDHGIYRGPDAELGVSTPAASPRQRFWLACLGSFVAAPLGTALLFVARAPGEVFTLVALAAYAAPMAWVLLAHVRRSSGAGMVARLVVVGVGLSVAMIISAMLGMAAGMSLARLLGLQLWWRALPV